MHLSKMSMSDMNYNILAFRRTGSYPQSGKLLIVSSDTISNHVKSVERNRHYPVQQKIISKFNTGSDELLFYKTDIEIQYSINCDMAVEVSELVQTSKHVYSAKCFLPMLWWPADIPEEDKYIFIDAQDAIVIEPIVCNNQWHVSDKLPNQTDQFGLQIPNTDCYRVYNKLSTNIGRLQEFITSFGLKEYAKIVPISEEPILQEDTSDNTSSESTVNQIPTSITTSDLVFNAHPLSMFTNRLLDQTIDLMNEHQIQVTDDFMKKLERTFQQLTVKSDVYIDFMDDNLDEQ